VLGQPVVTTLIGDDGAPAPLPVAGSRFVVLVFWSPACEPCKQILPAVSAKREALAAKGAALLDVAVLDKDQTANDAKATLALWGIDTRFAIDVDGAYMRRLGATDVPAIAIVDSAGVLRWLAPDSVTISNVIAAIPE
jgi:thiol-disulfide isomerase/thioredoxin